METSPYEAQGTQVIGSGPFTLTIPGAAYKEVLWPGNYKLKITIADVGPEEQRDTAPWVTSLPFGLLGQSIGEFWLVNIYIDVHDRGDVTLQFKWRPTCCADLSHLAQATVREKIVWDTGGTTHDFSHTPAFLSMTHANPNYGNGKNAAMRSDESYFDHIRPPRIAWYADPPGYRQGSCSNSHVYQQAYAFQAAPLFDDEPPFSRNNFPVRAYMPWTDLCATFQDQVDVVPNPWRYRARSWNMNGYHVWDLPDTEAELRALNP